MVQNQTHSCKLLFNSSAHVLYTKILMQSVGIRGVYQGLTATIIKQGSNQAIRFFVMESLKDWYRGDDKNMKVPTLITGLFGACAGAASVFGNTPVDVVKTRMQVCTFHFLALRFLT